MMNISIVRQSALRSWEYETKEPINRIMYNFYVMGDSGGTVMNTIGKVAMFQGILCVLLATQIQHPIVGMYMLMFMVFFLLWMFTPDDYWGEDSKGNDISKKEEKG